MKLLNFLTLAHICLNITAVLLKVDVAILFWGTVVTLNEPNHLNMVFVFTLYNHYKLWIKRLFHQVLEFCF